MKLFKDYAVLAGGQLATKALGFVAFAWLARVLDPAGYGALEYMVGLAVLFGAIVEGGVGVVAVSRAAHAPATVATLAMQIPWARLLYALPSVPIMALLAIHANRSAVPVALAWLFALSLLTVPWRQEWLLQATERMGATALAQLIRALVFALLALAMIRSPQDLSRAGWAELASVIAMTLYCMVVQHRAITPLRARGSFAGFAPLVREGALVGASNIVFTVTHYAPLLLIGALAGAVETAWFAAASRITAALFAFSYIYHFTLYPAVTRATVRRDHQLGMLLSRSLRVTGWAGIGTALALGLLAEPLVLLAFGPKMTAAAPLLQILAWTLPIALCSGHARWALVAAGAQRSVLAAQTAGLAATVIVALTLGPWLGAPGYGVAAVGGALAVWLVAHQRAARLGTHPPAFRIIVPPLVLAIVGLIVARLLDDGWWPTLLVLGAFAAAAPLVDRRLLEDLRFLGQAKADTGPDVSAVTAGAADPSTPT